MNDFTSLGLEQRLLKALAQEGYETPTPIQSQAIPHVLAGKDLLGIAQTGTGKTASFALPILQLLSATKQASAPKSARALILSPTRELSAQIADSFRAYGRYMNHSVTTIFGGVGEQPQIQIMAKGIDILVATPGRLLDLVRRRAVDLSKIEIFVLDEADRMLDMGFINDIRKLIVHLPKQRQSLFFSATMPQEIGSLASDLLKDPVNVSVTPAATTVERIAQRVVHVDNGSKRSLLVELLRTQGDMTRTLVFTRTKHGADKVVRALDAAGIYSAAIHGNKSQSQRVSALNAFRAGRSRVLIATDIAARGIDVDGISHVINFDLPHVPESYVHRIGRTARAGADGIAIAFCDREERSLLRDIEKLTRQKIPSSEWKAPARDGQPQEARTEGAAAQEGEREHREERGERRARGERKPFGDRKGRGDRRPHGERRAHEGRPQGERHQRSERPQGERPAQGERRAQEGRPQGERHAPHGERRLHEGKPRGERHAHGDRPQGERHHGERHAQGERPHGKPHRGGKPHHRHADGERAQGKPHGERHGHGGKPQGERHAHGGKPHGDRPFKGPKPHRKGGKPGGQGQQGQRPQVRDGGGNALPRFLQRAARP